MVDENSWWYRRVKQRNEYALYWLGMCYYLIPQLTPVDGSDRDICKLNCFRKAAEQSHAGAQYSLAWLLYQGPAKFRNQNEGLRWYRLAAEQGHSDAIEKLHEIEASIETKG